MAAEGALDRAEQMARLSEPVDVLVVGGGATGLGVAVDGAVRGYRTAFVEARDFAQAPSSRSTKLIHGGVRNLPQGNIGLVREPLHERGILFHDAPHLGHELAFLMPAYTPWDLPYYGLGLKMHDFLAGSLRLTPSRWVGPRGACRLVPTVRREGLHGGIVYGDAQFSDARLAMTLARTAAYVVAEEMPGRLEDVLSRRLRALVLDTHAAIACAPTVASLIAQLQNKDAAWPAREGADFTRLAHTYSV